MAFFGYLRSVKNGLILFLTPFLLLPLPLVIGTSVSNSFGLIKIKPNYIFSALLKVEKSPVDGDLNLE